MSTPTKTSPALLVAWLVLIAGLVAAIVFFTLNGRAPHEEPDSPVVPVKPKETKAPAPKGPQPSRDRDRHRAGQTPAPRAATISGIVHSGDGQLVAGARIAIFPWTAAKSAQPSAPPNMDDIKLLNQIVYIAPDDDWTSPRALATWTGGDEDASRAESAEVASTETRDDGSFEITLAPVAGTGPFRLTAQKAGVGSASLSDVRAGGDRLEILLGPEASVTGVVLTEVDSVPVEGARVSFDSGARKFGATSGADGRFTVEGVTPGRYELTVGAKGRTPLIDPAYTVHPGDRAPVTLRLPRGTLLRVKAVVSKDNSPPGTGDPLPNAQIAAYCEDAGLYVLGKTNAGGDVEFPGVPAGRYTVNGLAPGVVSEGEESIVVDRNQVTQDVTVSFEVAVDTPIQVVDEDGRAVAAMDFYTTNNDEKYDSLRSMKAGATDSDGKLKFAFEFDGPRGSLYGFKPGYALVRAFPKDSTSGDLIQLVAKKAIRVHGTVKTNDGRPIPDTVVAISVPADGPAGDDMELEIRADKDGLYDFPYLPHVEGITISATAPDGISQGDQDLELVAGQTDYTTDLLIDLEEPVPPKPHGLGAARRGGGQVAPPVTPPVVPPAKDDDPKHK
jgi:hypothetical protein